MISRRIVLAMVLHIYKKLSKLIVFRARVLVLDLINSLGQEREYINNWGLPELYVQEYFMTGELTPFYYVPTLNKIRSWEKDYLLERLRIISELTNIGGDFKWKKLNKTFLRRLRLNVLALQAVENIMPVRLMIRGFMLDNRSWLSAVLLKSRLL